jgi:hypothetical protein
VPVELEQFIGGVEVLRNPQVCLDRGLCSTNAVLQTVQIMGAAGPVMGNPLIEMKYAKATNNSLDLPRRRGLP